MNQQETSPSAGISCMEVWGGNHPTAQSLYRPGVNLHVWSQSANESQIGGGDVHYVSSCASGRITRMLLADICGCGSVFSEMAGELRNLMMRNVNSVRQSRLVRDMNDRFENFSTCGGYASALISTYFSPTRTLAVCNAGHPPPLVFSGDRQRWLVMRQHSSEVGHESTASDGVLEERDYQHFRVQLGIGDLVFTCSNTITECRGENGQLIGVGGLVKLLEELPLEADRLIPALLDRLRLLHPRNLVAGDATMMMCEVTDRGVGWKDNLLAPLRLLRRVSNNTQLD